MKTIPTLISIVLIALIVGGLLADIGEVHPAYAIEYSHILTAVMCFGGFWYLGYMSKDKE